MSYFRFIATDYELPMLENPKIREITVKQAIELGVKAPDYYSLEEADPSEKILYFEKESDLGELTITKNNSYEESVRWYTDKPFIYAVNFKYSIKRAEQLLQYLKNNIKKEHQLQFWSIELYNYCNGNNIKLKSIEPIVCKYEDFDLEKINQIYCDNYNKLFCYKILR